MDNICEDCGKENAEVDYEQRGLLCEDCYVEALLEESPYEVFYYHHKRLNQEGN